MGLSLSERNVERGGEIGERRGSNSWDEKGPLVAKSSVFGPTSNATTLFSDNQAAIALTRDHQYHVRTTHIDVRYHFIRCVIEQGSLHLVYCPTDDMVADMLTKTLPLGKVKHFVAGLGLHAK